MTAPTPPPAPGAPSDAGTGGQAPQGTQPPATPPAPQPTGQEPNQPQGQPQDVSSLPEWAQKLITDTRAEAAKHRTNGQTAAQQAQAAQQQRDAVLKALGLTADGKDAPPDPEALTAQLEQQQAVAWTNAVELTVFRTAAAAGANADALLDSRAFIDSLDELADVDPSSADFKSQLDVHVRKYVEQHPQFKAQPAGPARSGGDHPGGGGAPTTRPKSLADALRSRLGNQ